MSSIRNIAIMGSTGTIGVSALDIVRRNPQRFRVLALSAHRNIELLQKQIEEFNPLVVSVADESLAKMLKKSKIDVLFGTCLLYTSPSPRDATLSRMPSSA